MNIKEFDSSVRSSVIEMPEIISTVPGIRIFGRVIKSIIFTTDIALIKNTNADAVMAVHPFTTLALINRHIIDIANMPVFCGLSGALMSSEHMVALAVDAEFSGAAGIILGPDTSYESAAKICIAIDIPVIATIVSEKEDLERKIECGIDMFNVSGAEKTCRIVEMINDRYSYMPIIATGGPTDESIAETISCGADAITYTPPSNADIFKKQIQVYRDSLNEK